jgi:hypothetical protein
MIQDFDNYLSSETSFIYAPNRVVRRIVSSPSSSKIEQKKKKSKKKGTGIEILLPIGWTPTPCSIIIGRGKKIRDMVGNRRLRHVVKTSYLHQYAVAIDNKATKTHIVSSIVDAIKQACPTGGAFVRHHGSRWYAVDDCVAREKVGYVLRDLLADHYESSSKSKVLARKLLLEEQQDVDVKSIEPYHICDVPMAMNDRHCSKSSSSSSSSSLSPPPSDWPSSSSSSSSTSTTSTSSSSWMSMMDPCNDIITTDSQCVGYYPTVVTTITSNKKIIQYQHSFSSSSWGGGDDYDGLDIHLLLNSPLIEMDG